MMVFALALALGSEPGASPDPNPAAPSGQAVSGIAVPAPAPPPLPAGPVLPALTVIEIVLDADISSKTNKSGDTFPLHLAAPLVIDGRTVAPAGTQGQGEVVHAKKGGGMGAAGELVLAARWLDIGGRRLRLRSLNFADFGKDKIKTVSTLSAAAASAPYAAPVALLGFFITGGNKVYPRGTTAQAKTAEDFPLDPPAATAAPSTSSPQEKPNEALPNP